MNSEVVEKKGVQSFLLALSTGICFVFAFYPFSWAWMGWLAPLGVLFLVNKKQLPGKRPYLQIWLGLFLCWLALFQCVRLPHWGGYIGWPILSGFLCTYVFLFVCVTRQFVHSCKVPLLIAAPVCWVGLEYIQAYFCTGISLGMLSHTVAVYPWAIQIADIAGCYTVSFFMVGIAAGMVKVASAIHSYFQDLSVSKTQIVFRISIGLGQSVVLLGIMLVYGNARLSDADKKIVEHPYRIALIQGSIDTRFPPESEIREYLDSFTREYTQLSQEACEQGVDLIMWPESMFPVTDFYKGRKNLTPDEQLRVAEFQNAIYGTAHIVTGAGRVERTNTGQRFVATGKPVPILAGANSSPVSEGRIFYNSAILISDEGKVVSRYGKMKLVLFGEFVPFGEIYPWIYSYFPIPPGLKAWNEPIAMEQDGFTYVPSICFESTYPHLIRDEINYLRSQEKTPDVLVNLTNDGWFYGTNALDMHLANNIYRAVENRMPMLIAANTGFSGQIDSAGRVLARGPRRDKQVVVVNAITSKQTSFYHRIGDWPAFCCFIVVLAGFFQLICAPFLRKKLQLNDHLDAEAKTPKTS